MNTILKSHFQKFREHYDYTDSEESVAFEAFSISSVSRRYHTDSIDIGDHISGGEGDGCLDAILILVNGKPVGNPEDVKTIANRDGELKVEFVFVQAKGGKGFEKAEVGGFLHGIEEFFQI